MQFLTTDVFCYWHLPNEGTITHHDKLVQAPTNVSATPVRMLSQTRQLRRDPSCVIYADLSQFPGRDSVTQETPSQRESDCFLFLLGWKQPLMLTRHTHTLHQMWTRCSALRNCSQCDVLNMLMLILMDGIDKAGQRVVGVIISWPVLWLNQEVVSVWFHTTAGTEDGSIKAPQM